MTSNLACTKKFDPAAFMGESWFAGEEDERGERVTEIDLSAIALVTCLKKDEALQAGERMVPPLSMVLQELGTGAQ